MENKEILQHPLNTGFKWLQSLPSSGTISEKLGKKCSQQDPILLLDISSKKAQEEGSDLLQTEVGFPEDGYLGYPHHSLGYRYFQILFEAL